MTSKTSAKSATAAKDTAADMTSKVTEGAREFLKRTAETVQERADGIYENTQSYNAQIEDTLKRAASGYANILGSLAEAAYSNLNHTLNAVDKLAAAQTASEALQIQADFVREHSTKNMEHARSAFEYVRDVASENVSALRDGYANMMPSSNKTASAAKKAA